MADVKHTRIQLTERELRELLIEVDRYKERKMIPDKIWVDSPSSKIGFEILLQKKPSGQKDGGFHGRPIISSD